MIYAIQYGEPASTEEPFTLLIYPDRIEFDRATRSAHGQRVLKVSRAFAINTFKRGTVIDGERAIAKGAAAWASVAASR